MPYESLDDFASTRIKAVAHRLESPELAALMIEKFAEGLDCGGDRTAIPNADKYCSQIDPNYKENRRKRYTAYAQLDLSHPRDQ